MPEQFDLRDVLLAHADDVETLGICANRSKAQADWIRSLYK